MNERRRSRRFQVALPVRLGSPNSDHSGETREVSRHGLFIETEEKRSVGELVQMWLTLPGGAHIGALGVVARCAPDRSGIGIRLHMLSGEDKDRWDELLESLGDADTARSRAGFMSSGSVSRPRFLVRPKSEHHLEQFAHRELRLGGIYLRTPVTHPIGGSVEIFVIHPVTDVAFEALGQVVVAHTEGPVHERGVGLVFSEPDSPLQRRFAEFRAAQAMPMAEA